MTRPEQSNGFAKIHGMGKILQMPPSIDIVQDGATNFEYSVRSPVCKA